MSDLISRQDAIDAMEEAKKQYFDRRVIIGKMQDIVNNLPSAEPVQKMGKWIKKKNVRLGDYIECSLCQNAESRIAPGWWDAKRYCPNCGAKMEVQE